MGDENLWVIHVDFWKGMVYNKLMLSVGRVNCAQKQTTRILRVIFDKSLPAENGDMRCETGRRTLRQGNEKDRESICFPVKQQKERSIQYGLHFQ